MSIFLTEKKFLSAQPRGGILTNYENIIWIDQILLLVEDFEGIDTTGKALADEKFFNYGGISIMLDTSKIDESLIASKTALKVQWNGTDTYGGWGKGIGSNLELNPTSDFVNFRVLIPTKNGKSDLLKLIIEEDDNDNGILEKEKDDTWAYKMTITSKDQWQMISIPLKNFYDENSGGDHLFNVTRKGGIHTLIFSFEQPDRYTRDHTWFFDFISFSKYKLEVDQVTK
ncbi:MAG: hypothetical protein V4608_02325 [Bacteroidota bacterium]